MKMRNYVEWSLIQLLGKYEKYYTKTNFFILNLKFSGLSTHSCTSLPILMLCSSVSAD